MKAATRRATLSLAVLLVLALRAATLPAGAQGGSETRRSGFADMSPATQAMQRDDAQNPAMLWVQDGAATWDQPAGRSGHSCAACHGAAATSMRGVAARYPAWDAATGGPVDLAQRIQACRVRHQQAPPLASEGQELLALESFIGKQSRSLPVAPPDDPRLAPARARGEALFRQRMGQLDLSCAQCHDERAGGRLGSSLIPQGRALGYPVYRLEWQGLGSLQRRLRNCMSGVRAEPFAYGAPELVELGLYLALRDRGMAGETPGVRP